MAGAKSFVLTYHSLDHSNSVISLPPSAFRRQMEMLRVSGRPVVPLDQVRNTPGSVAITFDDGYWNFHEFALPVLFELSFPATVFVATNYIGKESNWREQISSATACRLMSRAELQEASEHGITVGAHTASHEDLTRLPDEQIIAELEASREALTTPSGDRPKCFAYPFGACDERVRAHAARCFELACGTRLRFLGPNDDPFDLPRLDVYYFRDIGRFQALIEGRANAYVAVRRGLRQLRLSLSR